ncbi:MAG: hypothetical protein HYV28_10780, partial [Ignavibacteriales bacterium]|nr:hypothetical protein [Ignavibacteriales bacterium]
MKNRLLLIGLIVFFSAITVSAQSISIPITISDNAASPNSQLLYLGVDTSASDGIDLGLGETELPPMPPTGNFEARLLLPSFSGSLASRIDYRYGTKMQTGEIEYRLRYQKHTSASSINVGWELPANATGVLKDVATNGVVINITMQGSGSFTVINPSAFNQLKLYITYTSLSFPVTISDNAASPNSATLYFGLHPEATDGIDLDLGESELPPMPPSGNFEARMLLPAFSGAVASYKDFRNGTSFTNEAYEYRLRYQKHSSATSITIAWSLPSNIIGVLKDVATNGVVINVTMLGSGSYTVTNPNSFNQVKLFVSRKTEPILEYPITISDNASSPNSTTLSFGLHPEATDSVDLDLG